MVSTVRVTEDHVADVEKAIRELARVRVLVGIPAANATRRTGHVDNVMLGYIHERGSPIRHIPARPFLFPGVENSRDQWTPHMAAAAKAAFEGKSAAMNQSLTRAGLVAVAAVKMRIRSNIPPPLAQATIAARRRRSAGSSYRRKATTPEMAVALIDTAQLINSLTSVVERRGP
jgi:hypothetical protein